MFIRRRHMHVHRLACAVIALSFIGVTATPFAFARIAYNTIDAVVSVNDEGRHLVVTGPIACTASERAYLRVTVTQRITGTMAEGYTLIVCTGAIQQWEVHATAQGKETFEPGSATAVAVARTTTRAETTDAHQWLVAVTLVDE